MTIISGILVYVMFIELQCHTKSSYANCISPDHEILQTIQKKENQNSKMIPESPSQSKICPKKTEVYLGNTICSSKLFHGPSRWDEGSTPGNHCKCAEDDGWWFWVPWFSVGFWMVFWFRTRWWGMRMARFLQREVESESRMNVSVCVFWHNKKTRMGEKEWKK